MPRSFTMLHLLGRGAHGAVHLAEVRDDEDFVQILAIKRLLPEWSGDRELAARLKDEARLLALLHHEHVVRVHGLTWIDGGIAILMEPVLGVDLARLVAEGPLPVRVATEIVACIADALDAAWTAEAGSHGPLRVVHRDIKPSNVMVTPRGGVKVMDFGVARATFASREVETRSQQLGTARYMAPERWLQGEAGHASDVFSLGITFVELTTGTPAERPRLSPGPFASDLEVLLDRLPDNVPRDLVAEMCAFDPADRPDAASLVRRCRALAATLDEPDLRSWAADHVAPQAGTGSDPTLGTVVHEDASVTQSTWVPMGEASDEYTPVAALDAGWRPATWGAVGSTVLAGLLILGISLGGTTSWRPFGGEAPTSTDLAVQTPVAPSGAPPPAPMLPPAPTVAAPAPAVAAPAPAVAAPAPAVAAPAPAVAAPAPAVVPPAPEPPPPTVDVRFVVASGLQATTDWGDVRGAPKVIALPADAVITVGVEERGEHWSCTIAVGRTTSEVRISPKGEGGCTQ